MRTWRFRNSQLHGRHPGDLFFARAAVTRYCALDHPCSVSRHAKARRAHGCHGDPTAFSNGEGCLEVLARKDFFNGGCVWLVESGNATKFCVDGGKARFASLTVRRDRTGCNQ